MLGETKQPEHIPYSAAKNKKNQHNMLIFKHVTKSISRVLYLMIIYLGRLLPIGSSDLPTGSDG